MIFNGVYLTLQSDIDECETKLNLCSKPEICVNKKGSYICVNPEEDYEDSDDFDVSLSNCPEGYKFDSENKLCNGKCTKWKNLFIYYTFKVITQFYI